MRKKREGGGREGERRGTFHNFTNTSVLRGSVYISEDAFFFIIVLHRALIIYLRSFLQPPLPPPRQWGTAAATIKVSSAENSELSKVLSLKPKVGQNIDLHARMLCLLPECSRPSLFCRPTQKAALTRLQPAWNDRSISLGSRYDVCAPLSHPSSCMLVNH